MPSLLALLLDACPDLATRAPALRLVATSGEPLPEGLARRFYAAAPAIRLVNIYGSTEVAGDATLGEVPLEVPERITIGRPLTGVVVELLGEDGQRVADGAIGELTVAGPVVASGYWKRPELTAARFVRDPVTQAVAVRTGDLARRLPDGELLLAGRIDDQLKIAGVRVELGEVERALRSHPRVRAAAATGHVDGAGRTRLVAGVVGDVPIALLREHLRAHLPAAALPSALAHLPAIPHNGHGKIDRRRLAATVLEAVARAGAVSSRAGGGGSGAVLEAATRPGAASGDAAGGGAPWAVGTSGGEAGDLAIDRRVRELAAWFAELVDRPHVGPDDELEAIGGDSLARLGLLVRLEGAGDHLERDELPRPLTPRRLAERLRERLGSAPPAPERDELPRPLTPRPLGSAAPAPERDELPRPLTPRPLGSAAPAPERDELPRPLTPRRLAERLRERLGSAPPAPERDELPRPLTPRRLAARLRERLGSAAPAPAIEPDRWPLTDFQRVMVLESLANAGTAMWTDQLAYTLHGPLDLARLAEAWGEIVAGEPALRTSIEWRAVAAPVQVVHDRVAHRLEVVELRTLEREAYRQRVLAAEWVRLSTAFGLDEPPLFRLCVIAGPGGRHDLIFTYHHVILDGESARRVLRRLLGRDAGWSAAPAPEPCWHAVARIPALAPAPWREALAGYRHGAEPEPPGAVGMGDLAWKLFHGLITLRGWQAARRVRRRAGRGDLARLVAAAGLAPAVYLGGDLASQPLARALARSIRDWSRAHRTTPTALWASALAIFLARERGSDDVVFGVLVSGRDGRSAATIGMLANCLPLRVRLVAGQTIDQLVDATTRGLAELEALGRTPLLGLAAATGLDPRLFLDTLLISWAFAPESGWTPPAGIRIVAGRGVTMTAPRTALIVSPDELAVGSRTFHRTDRIRRQILAIVEAILEAPAGALVVPLVAADGHEAGMVVGLAGL